MKVLIIGGTRFLGAAIARELVAHGNDVTVFHRGQTDRGKLPDTVTHILGDARDRTQVEDHVRSGGFDAVVDTILNADDLEWYLPLLQECSGKLVHCGSTGVYAPAESVPVREDDPTPCPPEFGGFRSKLLQDQAVVAFHEKTGFPVCSLRISNVYGAGDVPLDIWGARQPQYFQRVADGKPIWIPNDGKALLQPVHVEDLARGFRAALERDCVAGQIYNLSSDRAVTLTRYVELAKELLGSDSPTQCVPMDEIIATGKANEAGIRFVCEHMSIDSARARRDLDYTPRFDVKEGLRDSLQWMVAEGLLNAEVG
ncbi:MAG: NAD-dependent epimerase/dehydratase family protein [bacterium]|nr:NAD-dependent epimerase/dehydratase family protein [bacterium]